MMNVSSIFYLIIKSRLGLARYLALAFLVSCFGSGNDSAKLGTFDLQIVVSDASSTYMIGASPSQSFRVRVSDKEGRPASAMDVIFERLSNSETIVETAVGRTDANGFVECRFRLSSVPELGVVIRAKLRELPAVLADVEFDISAGGEPQPTSFVVDPPTVYRAAFQNMPAMPNFTATVRNQFGQVYTAKPGEDLQIRIVAETVVLPFLFGTRVRNVGVESPAQVTFSDLRYSKVWGGAINFRFELFDVGANAVRLSATRSITIQPNDPYYSIVVLPGQTLNQGYGTLAEAVTGTPLDQRAAVLFDAVAYLVDEGFNPVNEVTPTYTLRELVGTTPTVFLADHTAIQKRLFNGTQILSLDPRVMGSNRILELSNTRLFPSNALVSLTGGHLPSSPFLVGPGAPAKLAITQQPSATNARAGVAFDTPLRVQVRDQFNNNISTLLSDIEITVKAYTDVGCTTEIPVPNRASLKNSVLTATTATAGESNFSAMNYEKTGLIYFKAEAPTLLSTACSSGVLVNSGVATQLVWSPNPAGITASQTAGEPIAPALAIQLMDAFNNFVTISTQVEVKVYVNGTCPLLTPTEAPALTPSGFVSRENHTKTVTVGAQTFSDFRFNRAGTFQLRVVDLTVGSTLKTACTSGIIFQPGAASKIVFGPQPPVTHNADNNMASTSVQVTDFYGNLSSATGLVSIHAFAGGANACLSQLSAASVQLSDNTATLSASAATFNILKLRKAGNYRLGAQLGSGAVIGCAENDTTVNPGVATKLGWEITGANPWPTSAVTTAPITPAPIARIEDQWGNPATGTGSVTVAAFSDALCQTPAEIKAPDLTTDALSGNTGTTGIALSALQYRRAESLRLVATSPSFPSGATPCSAPIPVSAGVATKMISVTTLNDTHVADNFFTPIPTVRLVDTFNNKKHVDGATVALSAHLPSTPGTCNGTSGNGSLQIQSGGVPGIAQLPLTTGEASFANLTYRKAEIIRVQASITGPGLASVQPLCLPSNNALDVSIVAGQLKKLGFSAQPLGGPHKAGVNFGNVGAPFTVVLNDEWDNLVNDNPQNIALSAVNSTGVCDASNPALVSLTGGAMQGSSSGSVSFTSVSYTKQQLIRVRAFVPSAPSLTAACSNVMTIIHNDPKQLVFFNTAITNTPITTPKLVGQTMPSFKVQVRDAYDNLVNTTGPYPITIDAYNDAACNNIHYALPQTPLNNHDKIVGNTADTLSGEATFSTLSYRITGSTVYFRASMPGILETDKPCSTAVLMNSPTPASLVWSTPPSTTGNTADAALATQPRLTLKDIYGNTNTFSSSSTKVKITPHTNAACSALSHPTTLLNTLPNDDGGGNVILNDEANIVAGEAQLASLTYRRATAPGTPIYFKAAVTGTSVVDCLNSPIQIAHGTPTKLRFATQPQPAPTAGTALVTQPRAELRDAYGNVATTDSSTPVAFGLFTNSTCSMPASATTPLGGFNSLVYTPLNVTAGIAQTTDLTANLAGTFHISATSAGKSAGCSSLITVGAGALNQISLVSPASMPAQQKADVNFPSFVVQALDIFGNRRTSTPTNIAVKAFSGATCQNYAADLVPLISTAGGGLSKNTTSGIATFGDIAYTKITNAPHIRLGAEVVGDTTKCAIFPSATGIIGGDPFKLAFATQPDPSSPATITAGTPFTESSKVQVQDKYSNRTSSTETVGVDLVPIINGFPSTCAGVQLSNSPNTTYSYTSLGSTSTATGEMQFNMLAINRKNTYRLKAVSATHPTLLVGCSDAVVVAPNLPTTIKVASGQQPPVQPLASALYDMRVEVQDDYGNIVDTETGTAITLTAHTTAQGCNGSAAQSTLDLTGAPTAYYLNGSPTPPASVTATTTAGIANFSNFAYRRAGDYKYSFTASSWTRGCSDTVYIKANAPSSIAFPAMPATTSADAALPGPLDFYLFDQWGNLANNGSHTLDLAVYTDALCTVAGPQAKFLNAQKSSTNGLVSFNPVGATLDLLTMRAAGVWYLKATSSAAAYCSGSLAGTKTFTINPGVPAALAWNALPAASPNLKAGQELNGAGTFAMPSLQAADAWGNAVGSSGHNITLAAFINPTCTTVAPAEYSVGKYTFNVVANPVFTSSFPATNGGGQSTATSFRYRRVGTYYFKATTGTFNTPGSYDSPCSPLPMTIQGANVDYMYLRLVSGHSTTNLPFAGAANDGTITPISDPSRQFFAASYDAFNNFIGNEAANWTLHKHDGTTPASTAYTDDRTNAVPIVITPISASGSTTVNAQQVGDGFYRLEAKNSANVSIAYSTLLNISTELVDRLEVALVDPGDISYMTNEQIPIVVTARLANDTVATGFHGSKYLTFTHNNGDERLAGDCNGNDVNNLISDRTVSFDNGVAYLDVANGHAPRLKFIKNDNTITVRHQASVSLQVSGTSTPLFNIARDTTPGAPNCVKMVRGGQIYRGTLFGTTSQSNLGTLLTLSLAAFDAFGNPFQTITGSWSTAGAMRGLLPILDGTTAPSVSFNLSRSGVGSITATNFSDGYTGSVTVSELTSNSGRVVESWNTDSAGNFLLSDYTVRAASTYDASGDTVRSLASWRPGNGTSWQTEPATANRRGSTSFFPMMSHLVSSEYGFDVIDSGHDLKLWMRFMSDTNLAIDPAYGNVRSIDALNGSIYMGMQRNDLTAGALVVADYVADKVFRFAASTVQQNSIVNRNSSSGWTSATSLRPTLLSSNIYAIDAAENGIYTYLGIAAQGWLQVIRLGNDGSSRFSAIDTSGQAVTAVKIAPNGNIYYAVKNSGLHRINVSAANFGASDTTNTARFNTGDASYRVYGTSDGVSTNLASLSSNVINAIDVSPGESDFGGSQNLIYLGTDRNLQVLHENSTLSSSKVSSLTYRGGGQPLFNQAAEFNGPETGLVNSHISIPHKTGGASFTQSFPAAQGTIEFWFRLDAPISATHTLFYKGSGGGTAYSAPGNMSIRLLPTGMLQYTLGLGDNFTFPVQSSALGWSKGTRYHVRAAWRWNGARTQITSSLWVNGNRVGTGSTMTAPVQFNNFGANNSRIYLGGALGASGSIPATDRFFGAIDELLIRNIAPADMNATSTGNPSTAPTVDGTVAYLYRFDSQVESVTSRYNVARDETEALPANAGDLASLNKHGIYANGALSSKPFFKGSSKNVIGVKATYKNPGEASLLHMITSEGWSEIIGAKTASPSFSTTQGEETTSTPFIGFSIFNIGDPSKSSVMLLKKDENIKFIWRAE